jgi:hypothetical protein
MTVLEPYFGGILSTQNKTMIARANLPQNENAIIRDTWKQVSVVNGTRIVHRAETTTIPRYNDKSPSNPKGKTTDQSLIDVSDLP